MIKKIIFSTLLSSLAAQFSFGQAWKSKLNQARTYYQNGNYDQSLQLYEEAKSLAPESIDFSSEIGQAAYKSGNFPKAKSYFESAISTSDNTSIKSDEYFNLGNSQMKMKDFKSAINSYKEALRKNPNDSQSRYNLSEAIRQNKKNNQQSNDNSNENNDTPNEPKDEQKKENNQPADIPKRSVDRILDNLSKKESETKKKLNNSTNKKTNTTNSEKDW